MNRPIAAGISGALLAMSTSLLPPAAVAADTCQGQPATVAPDAQGKLVGTPLADVIVAHEGQPVDAGLGDDLICLIGADHTGPVDAGPGDDTVDATLSTVSAAVSLGPGEDRFVGGPGRDFVYATADEGSGFPGPDPIDTERDVISTGAADDQVFSGSLGVPNPDVITTGHGNDRIHLEGLDHATTLAAGQGDNTAIITLAAPETEAWLVDVGQRTLTFADETSSWTGSLHRWQLHLADGQARSSVVFLGTSLRETAFVSGDGLVPHFRTGDGADWAGNLSTAGGTYRLGSGRDRLTLGKYDSTSDEFPLEFLDVDLRARTARFGSGIQSPVTGVEWLRAGGVHVRAAGTRRADRITVNGCDVAALGRAGNDVLVRGRDVSTCADLDSRLFGGPGRDVLFGSPRTDDVLVGGSGFDRARGMRGTDTCRAEVTRGCELP